MNWYKVLAVVLGVVLLVGGVWCAFTPVETVLALAWVVGVFILADGVGHLVLWWRQRKAGRSDGWLLASAVVSVAFGAALVVSFAMQVAATLVMAYLTAAWILVVGVLRIMRAFRLRRLRADFDLQALGNRWGWALLAGILLVAVGILSILNPGILIAALGVFVGVDIAFAGANLIMAAIVA